MSNRSPEVTIMVPSHNSVKYIDSTILSVIAQKHKIGNYLHLMTIQMDRSHQGNSSWNNKTRIEPSSLGIKVKDDESIIKELFRVRIDHTQQSTYINQWEGLQRNLVLHEKIGRHVSGQATPLQDDNGNYLGSLPLVNQKRGL